jgi:CBS-domain-containing membrane protein
LYEHRIKHLPVVSEERLVGIVSDHDLQARAFFGKHPRLARVLEMYPDHVRVNSVMTTEVRTVKPSDNLGYAAQLMHRIHIGAPPVLEQGRLAGIISRSDLPDVSSAPGVKTKLRMTNGESHSSARENKPARRSSESSSVPQARWPRALRHSHGSHPGC